MRISAHWCIFFLILSFESYYFEYSMSYGVAGRPVSAKKERETADCQRKEIKVIYKSFRDWSSCHLVVSLLTAPATKAGCHAGSMYCIRQWMDAFYSSICNYTRIQTSQWSSKGHLCFLKTKTGRRLISLTAWWHWLTNKRPVLADT